MLPNVYLTRHSYSNVSVEIINWVKFEFFKRTKIFIFYRMECMTKVFDTFSASFFPLYFFAFSFFPYFVTYWNNIYMFQSKLHFIT